MVYLEIDSKKNQHYITTAEFYLSSEKNNLQYY